MPHRTSPPIAVIASLVTGMALACEPAPSDGWAGTEVDSAGARIVTNPTDPLWSPEEGWWVEEVVRVTPDEDVPETLFGYVVDADVDSAGRIYALDQQAQAVRVFGPDGAFLTTLGGPGDGPGEIGVVATSVVVTPGDTILVGDWVQGHLDRYRPDGTVLDPLPLPEQLGGRGWLEWSGGRLWLRTLELSMAEDGEGWSSVDRLWAFGEDGPQPVLDFTYSASNLGARGAPTLPLIVNAPMWTALPDGRVAWSTLESQEVRIQDGAGGVGDPAGATARIRSEAWRARSPSATDLEALRILVGERLEMLGGDAETVDRLPIEEPPVLPVLTQLATGPDSTLWVQRIGDLRAVHPMATNTPDPPTTWGGPTWDVLDGRGRYLGSVEFPSRFRLLSFRGDLLVGAVADPRNVDSLVLLRLNR